MKRIDAIGIPSGGLGKATSKTELPRVLTQAQAREALKPKRRHKYGVSAPEDRTYNGVVYDSKAEAGQALELDILVRSGSVKEWFRQIPFPLVVEGKLICTLVVDFRIVYKGGTVVNLEIKGVETAAYRIKLKLFRALYPTTELKVVRV